MRCRRDVTNKDEQPASVRKNLVGSWSEREKEVKRRGSVVDGSLLTSATSAVADTCPTNQGVLRGGVSSGGKMVVYM